MPGTQERLSFGELVHHVFGRAAQKLDKLHTGITGLTIGVGGGLARSGLGGGLGLERSAGAL